MLKLFASGETGCEECTVIKKIKCVERVDDGNWNRDLER